MGAGLCDGVETVLPPPPNTPSHYRAMLCNNVPAIQQQYSLRAMEWYRRLGSSSVNSSASAVRRAIFLTPCFGCSAADPTACCSGQGACLLGICACFNGWSGLDCAHPAPADPNTNLSGQISAVGAAEMGVMNAAAAKSRSAARVGVSIYVYDVPAALGLLHRPLGSKLSRRRHLYMAEDLFVARLLQDTVGRGAVRTVDPDMADLFFVPTLQVSHLKDCSLD